MKLSREEKRVRLEVKARQVIDEYLDWEEKHPKPKLTEIEDVILELRKELGREMAQMLLEEQEERKPVPGPRCRSVGRKWGTKGKRETRLKVG